MDFSSDNASGATPPILRAIVEAASGSAPAYGADPFTTRAARLVDEVFERACATFLVATGTAANALALGALTPPWGAVFCHEDAHVNDDECGAPEFYTAGAKLVGLPGAAGLLEPGRLAAELARYPRGLVKQVQPAALSLSQASECGTTYAPAMVGALCEVARGAGLKVHMDGARFANAVAALGCAPADLTWRAGVDVLCLGATKNGALACEAVVVFDPALAADLAFRRKRGGHTLSKGRLLGAQMEAYLAHGHWLECARVATARWGRLSAGLARAPGCRIAWPTEVNEVFAVVPAALDAAWRAAGARYYDWGTRGLPPAERPAQGEVFVRLVASFATTEAEVDGLLALAKAA